MANKKINELLSRTPSLSDLMLVGDPSSGYSYKCTVTALATIIETDIADGYVTLTTTQTISGAKTFSNVLTLTSVANSAVDTDKFLVLTGTNTVNYRTGAEVLSDIGGASASSISGTTNYVAKFTSSSAVGNSIIFDNGTNVGISTTSPSYKLDISGTLRSTDSSYFATSSGNIGIGTNSVTGIGGPILHIHAPTYPEIHLTNSTTGNQFQDGTSIHVNSSSLNILNYESGSINLSTSGTQRVSIASDGNVTLSVIANATTDTDRFLVSDSGVIKYRTGAELLSDIGGQGSLSLSAIGSTPNANGATLSSNTLTLQPASASFGGVMTTGFQEFAGQKRFVGNPIQFDKHLEIKNNNSWGVSWGYTSFASKDTPVFGFLRGHSFTPTPTSYNAWFTYGSTGDRNYTLPSSDGTLALTSDITSSISGTTNYIPKFTSSNAIGNSVIYESGGSIGIGTISPSTLLHLNGLDAAITIFGTRGTTGSHTIGASGINNNNLAINAQNNLVFSTNSSERMRLDASGNLGLGTSSPQAKLDIQGNVIMNGQMTIQSSGVVRGYFGDVDGTSNVQLRSQNAIEFKSGGNNLRATLDASGNLGLRVTPSAWSSPFIVLESGSGSTQSFVAFQSNVSALKLGTNQYYSAPNYLYKYNGSATRFDINSTNFVWNIAPSGTAGNVATFTEAMTLDASGRLGIGTTSPLGTLDVANLTPSLYIRNTKDGSWTSGETVGALNFYTNDVSVIGAHIVSSITSIHDGVSTTTPAGALVFSTAIQGATVTEKMRITSGGDVGIGTTSPTTLLSISGSTPTLTINRIAAGNYGKLSFTNQGTEYAYIQPNGANGIMRYDVGPSAAWGGIHAFFTDQSERMRITSGGEVLIGTTSDAGDYKLQVNGNMLGIGTASNSSTIRIEGGSGANTNAILDLTGRGAGSQYNNTEIRSLGQNTSGGILAFYTDDNTNALVERMRITSGGNVGIGTTSPTAVSNYIIQTINGLSGCFTEYQENGTNAFRVGSDASEGGFFNQTNAKPIRIFINSAERMRITSGGLVGIGTSAPEQLLDLLTSGADPSTNLQIRANRTGYGNVRFNLLTYAGGSTSTDRFTIQNNSGSNVLNVLGNGNVGIGTTSPTEKLHVSGGNIIVNSAQAFGFGDRSAQIVGNTGASGFLRFDVNNSERMRITSGGDVGIGTTSPGAKLEVNGAIKTAAPSGGTAQAWKLGSKVTAAALTMNITDYIEVEVNGVAYKLALIN